MRVFGIVGLILVVMWLINLVQFFGCDFEAPYKCEVIHSIGIVAPPSQAITVFFTEDK